MFYKNYLQKEEFINHEIKEINIVEEKIEIIVPAFTDFEHWSYLDNVLSNVKESDVILMEFYHEFKDLVIQFFKGNIADLKQSFANQMRELDPKLMELEPKLNISPSHYYILERLKGKRFAAFETLEDYDFNIRDIDERNEVIIKNIAANIENYSCTSTFLIFMAFAHSRVLRNYLNTHDKKFDLNEYTKQKFDIKWKQKEGLYCYSFILESKFC